VDSEGRIYVRPTTGQDDATLAFTANVQVELSDWSDDGRIIFFNRINPNEGTSEIWALDIQTFEATPILKGQWFENASLSPSGKWIAFTSDESGKNEVYVQSFPKASGRWMVSTDVGSGGAARPLWRHDGLELTYLRGGSIVSVPVTGDTSFSSGVPKILFGVSVTNASSDFAVSSDGQRILTNELPPTDQNKIGAGLIQNWMAALVR
jgi:dipeptidyl aminopeptidase/acylaminoacyl peptidase